MTKMIINADDFGYSNGINYGIIDAFSRGMLTSTTLMVTMPGFDHAIGLMKQFPSLPVGLHVNLTFGKPLSHASEIPSLLGPNSEFIKPKQRLATAKYNCEEVYREAKKQYQKFIATTGKKPIQIDTHLFSSDLYPEVTAALKQLAAENGIPLRNHETDFFSRVPLITQRTFKGQEGLDYISENILEISQYEYVEIMAHPGYVDQYLLNNSTYNYQRVAEVAFLTSEHFKILLAENKIECINFSQVPTKIVIK
ncbi:MAG: carbohydrate deacetylase [Culicoidibacterales bacterium]